MARATLDSLPNELLVHILRTDSLSLTDLIRCSRLSNRFHSIIKSTVELQYRILLLQSSLVNNEGITTDQIPLSTRLDLLRKHRSAIDSLRPTICARIPIGSPPGYLPGSTYELVDGIYARGTRLLSDFILTTAVTFIVLPSVVRGIDVPRIWTIDLGMMIYDFGIEPLMDLLVVVEARPQPLHAAPLFPVHFLTMRTGTPHPDARLPYVDFAIPDSTQMLDYGEYLFIIHTCGDLVAVLFRPRLFDNAHHLVVWNWRTGDLVCTYTAPLSTCVASFAFLDPGHILLAASHDPVSEFTFDVIRIAPEPFLLYCFHPPELSQGLNIPPPILRSSPCRAPPSTPLTAWPVLPPSPFYPDPSPDCRIFSLSLEFLYELWLQTLPHRVIGERRYVLFAPASLFLNPAPGLIPSTVSVTHIPWSWWSSRARWLDVSADPSNTHVCHTYGPRHVRWVQPSGPPVGSSSSPPSSPPLPTPSPGPTPPCLQLLSFPPPSLPLPASERIKLGPPMTSFDPRPIFAESVESELPYLIQTATESSVRLDQCEGLCVDGFERIIGIETRDTDDEEEALRVCVF